MIKRLLKRWLGRGTVSISAVVIHKDGTREDLGTIAKGKVEYRPEAN